jgi:hypothetical protein
MDAPKPLLLQDAVRTGGEGAVTEVQELHRMEQTLVAGLIHSNEILSRKCGAILARARGTDH